MGSIKNLRKNTIILLLITVIILFLVLKDDFNEIIGTLSSMNYIYIGIAIFFFGLSIILKAYVNYKTVADKEKISLKEAIKHNIIVQFFNGITPFNTGGQPMEIYMLTEHNIKVSHATNIVIQNFIFYQIALVIYGLFAVIYNAIFHIFPTIPILRKLVVIGFMINTLVAIILFFISFSKKTTMSVSHLLIQLLGKIKLIKDPEKTKKSVDKKLEEFHISATELRKRKRLLVGGIAINLLSLTCLYIVPLFILFALNNFTSMNVADTLVSSAYVLIIGAFVPIPGASGGVEYGFLKFYGNFLPSQTVAAVLLVWRFLTYYLGMIVGSIVFSLEKKVK